MVKKYLINLAGRNRDKKYNLHLGILLAFIAGAVDAGGFLYVGYYTSHMTGIASSLADFLALKNFYPAALTALFLLSFIFGSATCSALINFARDRHYRGEFAIPIMVEAIFILLFGFATTSGFIMTNFVSMAIILLCFIMGLQNAVITKVSRAEIRTTHITGIVTDIGIQIGKIFYKFFNKNSPIQIEYGNLRMHLAIFFAFCLGGFTGALSFKNFGSLSVIPFAAFLTTIALMTIFFDKEDHEIL